MNYTVIPDSVRLDPVNIRLIEHRPDIYNHTIPSDYLYNNPLWNKNEKIINLKAASNETIAFQIVLISQKSKEYTDIDIRMDPLSGDSEIPDSCIEIFKEWFVEVKRKSSGYEKTSLGRAWYPDALIPIQSKLHYYGAPFYIPDYWNRIDNQKAAALWVDIYVPKNQKPGIYKSEINIICPQINKLSIPVKLEVWPFSLPNTDSLKGSIFTNAFKKMDEERELKYQQMFKKHRVTNHHCYYRPKLQIIDNKPIIDWTEFDKRLIKYFDGSAFTEKYNYFGTGMGEPLEYLILPFDCGGGKHKSSGWPIADQDGKKDETFWNIWNQTAHEVKKHLFESGLVDSNKTQIQSYFNSLDEAYDRQSHDKMKVWGNFIHKHFPMAKFRIDGGYDDETLDYIAESIDLCLYHTMIYNINSIKKFRDKGIIDWIYGPMIYESETNGLNGSSTFIDLDLLTMRGLAWVCYKYKAQSWCEWEFNHNNKKAWYNTENFKNNSLEEFRCYNGSGMLLYDGLFMDLPDPCPSIRFKAIRTGSQEFEYLKLLEKENIDTKKYVDKLVYNPLGKNSIGNIEPWNTNYSDWDTTRIEMGKKLKQIYSN